MVEPTQTDATRRDGSIAPAGATQSGMRASNERLVLTLVRHHGALSRSDLARMTGLSAQTIWGIAQALEEEGLLMRGAPLRGRIGQPSVPLSLDPAGAFFMGAKIGRRSTDLVLLDFCGETRERRTRRYPFPEPGTTLEILREGLAGIHESLGVQASRIAGLGLAMPFELWNWSESAGAPAHVMDAWRSVDVRAELAGELPFPVYLQNDASAACAAELAFGDHRDLRDFVYFYVGSFIGGGLALNGAVHWGGSGNAGALGSLLVADNSGRLRQLIEIASLLPLERDLRAAGHKSDPVWADAEVWRAHAALTGEWINRAAQGIAQASVAATAVTDCGAVVIDGPFPRSILDRLIVQVRREIGAWTTEGVHPPEVRRGSLGPLSRAIGGASLPLFDRHLAGHALAGRQAGG